MCAGIFWVTELVVKGWDSFLDIFKLKQNNIMNISLDSGRFTILI